MLNKLLDGDENGRSFDSNTSSVQDKSNPNSISSKFRMSSKCDNRREKSLGLLTQNFVKLFICRDSNLVSLDEAAKFLLGETGNSCQMRTKVHRLYDIANVLSSLNFIEKTHHIENRKPAFRWLELEGTFGHELYESMESKKRVFGTDISNTSYKRNTIFSTIDQKTDQEMKRHIKCEDFVDVDNHNWMQQHHQPSKQKSKSVVFGPFRPINLPRVGENEKNNVEKVQDWETIASSYRPQYQNQGTIQGLHNIHGSFNMPNMPGSLASRNSTMNGVPSSAVQQPTGSLSNGRFASNNIPVALSQISHGSTHGHSGATNRGGMGVSPILGNTGPRITSSIGNIVGGGNIGRNLNSGGGLTMPGLASRLNLSGNSGSGSVSVQGPNRLMGGVLPQAPQVMSMLGNSYSGGPISQSQAGNNNLNSMGMLSDLGSNENAPFDINDFPRLTGRPGSSGGPQGQLGSMRKQGVSSIVQQNQEFSIQNEDFPALPGFKGGGTDFSMDLHQKEQLHDNAVSMMQSQHFPMGRSAGFSLGGSYSSHRQQQQQHGPSVSGTGASFGHTNNQDLLHLHGSDLFPSSHGSYHSQIQNGGPPSLGLRSVNNLNSYDQLIQQYQQLQNQPQFRLQQMSAVNQSYRDQNMKSLQATQSQNAPDPFGLLGLLSVIRMSDPDLTSLALGIDLTTLGLNLNSGEDLHKKFVSPWSDGPTKGGPEYRVPECYYAKQPPVLHQGYFSKFKLQTLFYIFCSMPRDEAQLYAANELSSRGWFYHKELRMWLTRVPNMEPLVKTGTYERGTYLCFDPSIWETIRKDNFVLHYEAVEKRPALPQQH